MKAVSRKITYVTSQPFEFKSVEYFFISWDLRIGMKKLANSISNAFLDKFFVDLDRPKLGQKTRIKLPKAITPAEFR